MLAMTATLFGALLIWGCRTSSSLPGQGLDPISARDWLLQNPKTQLIDVRTPEEYRPEHLKGAKLIPLQELEGRLEEIKKDKPILLYCHSGRRSLQALNLLKSKGYQDLRQIQGGITAWKAKELPVEMGPVPKP